MNCVKVARLCFLFVLIVAASCLNVGWSARERAESVGAKARICVNVVGEEGEGVSNAVVEVYYGMTVREGTTIKGITDVQGCFTSRGKTTGEVYVNVSKSGFYHSLKKLELYADEEREVSWGNWKPDTIPCRIVLRRIVNPRRLIASDGEEGHDIRKAGQWKGFDLEKNDWVAPDGRGETTDFEVFYQSDGKKLFEYTGAQLKIRFVRPFDGAYIRNIDEESDLKTDQMAKTNAVFLSKLDYFEEKLATRNWIREKLKKEQYLVLRVRSKVDDLGNFAGAHYALIIGPLTFGWCHKALGFIGINYLFNPTFNDPNLEQMNIYNTPNFNQIGSPSGKKDKRD